MAETRAATRPPRLTAARRSLALTFGILVALLLVLLAVGIGVSRGIHDSATEEFVEDAIPLKAAVQDLAFQMAAQQNAVRGFLLTDDRSALAAYDAAREGADADLAYIRANVVKHPELAGRLREAEPIIAELQRFLERQAELRGGTEAQRAEAFRRVAGGETRFAAFRSVAARMVADTDAFVRDAQGDQQRLTDILTIALLVLGALSIAAAARMSVVVRRRVAGLLDDIDAEREVSADAAVRAAALQRVTAALAPALDEDAVLAALPLAASAVAGIDDVVIARVGPGGQYLDRRSLRGDGSLDRRIPMDVDLPVTRAVRTGVAAFYPSTREMTEVHPELAESAADVPGRSWAVLPLSAGRGAAGALALRFDSPRDFGPAEREFLLTLADQVAQAIERVRLHREQGEIARVLQTSLLPRALPEIRGVRMAARYVAAAEGQTVGGDFYDVFEDGGGRLTVMMGDACGKGPEAVALTALARYTVRALADGRLSPAGALGRLNRAMRQQGFGTLFLTAADLSFRLDGDTASVTVCRAGHPHPLLVRASGAVEELGGPGTILGVFDDPPLVDRESALAPGDTVVVFTDGLTEARQGTSLLGEERLRDAAARCAGMEVEEAATHLLRTASDFAGGRLRDDVAVVIVRITDP